MGVPAKVMLEHRSGRLEAMLIVDQRIAAMRVVRSDAESIRAIVTMPDGTGELTLRVSGDTIEGTLTARKHAWKVTGVRSI